MILRDKKLISFWAVMALLLVVLGIPHGRRTGRLDVSGAFPPARQTFDAKARVIRERSPRVPRMTREDAGRVALAYIGQRGAEVTKEDSMLITDHSNPLADLNRRPVWEVVIDKIDISVGPLLHRTHNKNISRLSVLIDDRTGAILEIFSPKPRSHGLRILHVGDLRGAGLTLKPTTLMPRMTLLEALQLDAPELYPQDAKEIVAYYGLATDNFNSEARIKDSPCWIIYQGGIKGGPFSRGPALLPLPSGAMPPPRPTVYASEAYVVLDADTGEYYRGEGAGGPH